MRSVLRYVPAALAAAALGLAGCTSGGSPSATPTPTPSPTPVQACPYGDWSSTQVAGTAGAAGATATLQGGAGVTLAIAQDGAARADFTAMQPITFTGQLAGAEARGEFLYRGPLSGNLDLSGAASTASPGGATSPSATPGGATPGASPSATPSPGGTGGTGPSGPWQPVGQVTMTDLTVTIRVTAPVTATVADNVKVSEITNAQTTQVGNAVDLQPLLRPGQYSCGGDQLTVTLSGGTAPAVTWTFARA